MQGELTPPLDAFCPAAVTSETPTAAPVTPAPTDAPVTSAPTAKDATKAPTDAPVTPAPTDAPVTAAPTPKGATKAPTDSPVTPAPTEEPTKAPVTPSPTDKPETCSFCPSGLEDPALELPTEDGATCQTAKDFADSLPADDATCRTVQLAETLCCPNAPPPTEPPVAAPEVPATTEAPPPEPVETCPFCADGLVDPDLVPFPEEDGNGPTCRMIRDGAGMIAADNESCPTLRMAEGACCPEPVVTEAPPTTTEAPPEMSMSMSMSMSIATTTTEPPIFAAKSSKAKGAKSCGHTESGKSSKCPDAKTKKDPTKAKTGKGMRPEDPMAKVAKASDYPDGISSKGGKGGPVVDTKSGKALVDMDPKAEKASAVEKSAKATKVAKTKSGKGKSVKASKADSKAGKAHLLFHKAHKDGESGERLSM